MWWGVVSSGLVRWDGAAAPGASRLCAQAARAADAQEVAREPDLAPDLEPDLGADLEAVLEDAGDWPHNQVTAANPAGVPGRRARAASRARFVSPGAPARRLLARSGSGMATMLSMLVLRGGAADTNGPGGSRRRAGRARWDDRRLGACARKHAAAAPCPACPCVADAQPAERGRGHPGTSAPAAGVLPAAHVEPANACHLTASHDQPAAEFGCILLPSANVARRRPAFHVRCAPRLAA